MKEIELRDFNELELFLMTCLSSDLDIPMKTIELARQNNDYFKMFCVMRYYPNTDIPTMYRYKKDDDDEEEEEIEDLK